MRHHRVLVIVLALAVLFGLLAAAGSAAVWASETPRRGGVLLAVIGADAPSLDPHQESTFATMQPVAPLYSTLLQIDPYSYPNIIGDVASEWTISPDGLTYTFKIRPGIRFHDGSPLDGRRRQSHLRQDHLPAGGGPQYPAILVLGGGKRRGSRSEHSRVQAQVPVRLPAVRPGLTVERHLPEEVSRQGSEPFQEQRRGFGTIQVQELHAWLDVRRRAEPGLLRQGPSVPGRLQVLCQHGDVCAGGGHPVRPRLHRVPRPAQFRGGRDQEAPGGQGRRPDDALRHPVRHRHQQHRQAVHRCARPQGPHPRHSIATRGARCCTTSRASKTPGPTHVRARSGPSRPRSSRSSRASGGTPRRAGPRPSASWPRRVTPTASRSS